jgi:hypothetical protein
MITGPCPYDGCTGVHMIPIAPKCPAFSKEICDECGREYWLYHSRVLPEVFTPEEFAKQFDVNEETKQITRLTTGAPNR